MKPRRFRVSHPDLHASGSYCLFTVIPVNKMRSQCCLFVILLTITRHVTCRVNCGQRPVEENLIGRVVGGTSAIFGEVPWQASIKEYRLFGLMSFRKCGAVIIDSRWLLTAAHCTSKWFFSELVAIAGEHREFKVDHNDRKRPNTLTQNDLVQKRRVKRIIMHPNFNPRLLEDDLALVELEEPLRFDMNIQPICLPRRGDNFTHYDAFVSGWGLMKYRKCSF